MSLEGIRPAPAPSPAPPTATVGVVTPDAAHRATAERSAGRQRRRVSLDRLLNLGHRRLVALYAVSSFAILVALTGSALVFGAAAVRDQVDRGLQSSANASASYLGLSLRARADVLVAFAGRPGLATRLALAQPDPSFQPYAEDFLASLQHSIDGAFNAWVTTADGSVVAVSPPQPALVGQDFSYRDWFQGAATIDGSYLSSVYISATPPHPLVVFGGDPDHRCRPPAGRTRRRGV